MTVENSVSHGLRGVNDVTFTACITSMQLFEVIGNTDTTEGKGRRITLGWFVDEYAAKSFANGRGTMGYVAPIERSEKRCIIDEFGNIMIFGERVHKTDPAWLATAKREAILAKLTPEEIDFLDIK